MKKEIAKKIIESDNIAFFSHKGIDGDSLSSSYGLLKAIQIKYPKKNLKWVVDEEEMKANFPWFKYDAKVVTEGINDSFVAIQGDTATQNKCGNYEQLIKANYIICFDHHRNPINIKHDLFWSEPEYPASTIQAIEIVEELGIELNEEAAFALMIGLLTDTGNFRFSLNDPRPVEAYAKMIKHISREKMDEFWNTMTRKTLADIELQKLFYQRIQFEGKVAYIHFTTKDIREMGDVNFKQKIHSIGNIENYPIWCIFAEEQTEEGKKLKLHLRSNGPDVSSIAIKHNGGGHIRAAGAKVKMTSDTIENILKELNSL